MIFSAIYTADTAVAALVLVQNMVLSACELPALMRADRLRQGGTRNTQRSRLKLTLTLR